MGSFYDDDAVGKHKNPFKQFWMKYQFSVISYSALAVLLLFIYHVLSDGDFSFLMTLGSVLVAFAFALLLTKVAVTRSVQGISLKALQAYVLVFLGRLASILFYDGYLPFDKSGDWFYQAVEVLCLAMVVGLIGIIMSGVRGRYDAKKDRLGSAMVPGLPDSAGVLVLVVPAALLAMVLHPNLNGNWLTDVAWTFALYLEAVAIFPQLHMLYAPGQEVARMLERADMFETNFVFCTAVARALHFVFWLSSYHELNDKAVGSDVTRRFPGHLVVLAQIVNLLLLADFLYYHLSNAYKQSGGILPSRV